MEKLGDGVDLGERGAGEEEPETIPRYLLEQLIMQKCRPPISGRWDGAGRKRVGNEKEPRADLPILSFHKNIHVEKSNRPLDMRV